MSWHSALLVTLGCSILPGCGTGSSARDPLRIAAASDLQAVMPRLIERFQRDHGITARFTLGSSGQLAQQIKQGAPFDVFMAANQSFVRDLATLSIVQPSSVRPYVQGTLVLVVNRTGAPIEGLADLTLPQVKKIAIANPEFAPYGLAARQALERAGLWEKLQPNIVRAETVRQALQFVQTGNAEAGLVGRGIAHVPEVRVLEIDASIVEPIVQFVGIVAATKHAAEAETFTRFLIGETGQGILTKSGFSPIEHKSSPQPGR